MILYLLFKLTRIPYLDVHVDDDSLSGCLQILSLNLVSSGAMVQQPGFSHQIGRRWNRAGYTTDTMYVVFNELT